MNEITVNGLIKHKQELQKEIKDLQEHIKANRKDIEGITKAIRILTAKPKQDKSTRGSISRKLFDVLRDNQRPMSADDIAAAIIDRNHPYYVDVARKVNTALYIYHRRGAVETAAGEKGIKLWKIS